MKKLLVMLVFPFFFTSCGEKIIDLPFFDRFDSISTNNDSNKIQFPAANELSKTLNDLDQTYFVQNTSLVENLATKKLTETEIKAHVVACSNEYMKHISGRGMPENINSMMYLKKFRENRLVELLIKAYKK